MKKTVALCINTYFMLNIVFAQVSTREVLTSSGGTYTQINGTMSFSIGEIAVETFNSSENKLTQGMQQGSFVILSVPNAINSPIISVYPNPTSSSIKIEFTENISAVKLFDITGNLVLERKPNEKSETLDLTNYAMGVYVVQVFDKNNKAFTYRIQKI